MTTDAQDRPHSPASRARITVVEDDRACREMLREALEAEGFDVTEVSSGLRLISTLHVDRPDVLLLDVVMSWIDGFELCRAIKTNAEFKDIPIVIVTGRSAHEDIETGFQCGCTEYFTKPVDLKQLCLRIREILGESNHDL